MADDSSNLGLGILLKVEDAGALAALARLEAKLNSLVTSMNKVTSSFNKFAEDQTKSQTKVTESLDKSAKAMGDVATNVNKLSSSTKKSTEGLAEATKKATIANQALGISYKDAAKQMVGLGVDQKAALYSSMKSKEMFSAVTSELKKFKTASYESRSAIVDMAKSSDNNVIRFKQLTGALEKVEKSVLQTKDSMLKMGKTQTEVNAFAKGVDRVAASTAFLNGELYKTGNVLLSSSKSFVGLSKETEILATKYANLLNSNTSYAKQASEVIEKSKTSTEGFRLLGAQLANIEKAWKENVAQMKAWNTAVTKAGTGSQTTVAYIENLNKQISSGTLGYKEATTQLKEHLETVSKTGPAVGKLGQFVSGLHAKFTGMASTITSTSGYFYDMGRALVSMATWIPAAIIVSSLTTSITEAIASVADFNQALKNLQAISGGTDAEIKLLGDAILKISETTKYSASEISKGAVYIAQAGFTAAESLAVIEAASLGAQGTLEPLTTAADLLTTVIRSFQLEASEASTIMDALAVAANGSKTNLEGMRTVFNYIGPSAKAAGASLNETLGAVMALSNAGIKMSTVGTSLRQIFIGLEKPSKSLRTALSAAGLTIDDLDIKSKGLVKVLENLNTVVKGDLSNATAFFNVRANNSVLVLSSLHKYVSLLIDSTKRYGVAQTMAATQLDTITGKMSILSNRFKSMLITFSEGGITEIFKNFISAITKVVDLLNYSFNNALVKTIVQITALGAVVVALYTVFQKLTILITLTSFWKALTAAIELNTAATVVNTLAQTGLLGILAKVRVALSSLLTIIRSTNPWVLFATVVAMVGGYLYNTKKGADNLKAALQQDAIVANNAATSAESLAEKLRNLQKDQDKGINTTENYYTVMQQVGELYPDIIDNMEKLKGNYEAQAKLLDNQVIESKEVVLAKVNELNALNNAKFAYAEGYESQLKYSLGTKLISAGTVLLNNRLGEFGIALRSAGNYLVESSGKMDDMGMSFEAGQKAMGRTISAAEEMGSAIGLLDKKEQELVLSQLQGTEKYKDLVKSKVAVSNAFKEGMVANNKEMAAAETYLLSTLSENWRKYYEEQSPTNKTWLLDAFKKANDEKLKAEQNFLKSKEDAAKDSEGLRLAGETAFNEAMKEKMEQRIKMFEKEENALKKSTQDKLKILKKGLESQLSFLDMEEEALIAMARKREETTESAEEAELQVREEMAQKKINVLEESSEKEIDIINQGYEARKNLIDKESLYLEESDGKKQQYFEAEKDRSEQLIEVYEKQKTVYESLASKELAAMSKAESAIKSYASKIKAIDKELASSAMDIASMRASANKLTMDSNQQMAADAKMQSDLMSEGYRQMYAGNYDTAKSYFDKAKGLIESLSVTSSDVFDKEKTDAKATQKLRLGLIDDYETALQKLADTQKSADAAAKQKEEDTWNARKKNYDDFVTKAKEVDDLLKKQMVVNIDTTAALDKLKAIDTEIKKGAEFVIKFMAEASPKDTLDNTITKVKAKIAELKSSLTTENFGQFVVKFIGTEDGVTFSPLLTVINSLKNNLHNWSLSLTASVSNFLIQILGNDGSGQAFINTIIANVQSKFAALTSELSKGATYTITIKTVKVGSSESSGGSGSSGGSDSGGGAAPVQEAEGGLIPGTGDGDTVPALLTPGEFVIRKGVVQTLGEGFFRAVNSLKSFTAPKFNLAAVPAFASGGLVRSVDQGTFTLNLAVGNSSIPLKVVGNPNTMRTQIKRFEKELSKMRLSKR